MRALIISRILFWLTYYGPSDSRFDSVKLKVAEAVLNIDVKTKAGKHLAREFNLVDIEYDKVPEGLLVEIYEGVIFRSAVQR